MREREERERKFVCERGQERERATQYVGEEERARQRERTLARDFYVSSSLASLF